MDTEQFINTAAVELEMVEAQLRDTEARALTLRARRDGLRFVIQYGQEEAQSGARSQNLASGARRAGHVRSLGAGSAS
jgi:hypothetical protein